MPATPAKPMERNDGFRRILLGASAYRTAQRAIGAVRFAETIAAEKIRSTHDSVVVDIGCGTADILDQIVFATYTGFDPNPPYIEGANERVRQLGHQHATVFVAGLGEPDLSDRLPDRADIVMAIGVFHHLDDHHVHAALELAAQLVGETGRFLAFDPVLVPDQSPIARQLVTRDRGRHVRTPEATRAIVESSFENVEITIRHDLLRVPYSHILVEAFTASG